MSGDTDVSPYSNNFEYIDDELDRLDLAIALRVATLALQNQEVPEMQAARAAYITPAEVEWLLGQNNPPNENGARAAEVRRELARRQEMIRSRVVRSLHDGVFLALPHLSRLFGLSPFEQGAIVTCLAPELRRKYDRLFAYLQDDITRKRPSVDLVLELLCDTESQRWGARGLLSDSAPLLRAGLLRKVHDAQSPSGSSGLAHFLQLDPRICEFLLGSSQIDARLTGHAQFQRPANESGEQPASLEVSTGVWGLIEQRLEPGMDHARKLVLYLQGPYGVGKRELVLSVCRRLGCSLLTLDAQLLLSLGVEAHDLLRLAFREGLMQQAVLHLKRADSLLQDAAHPLLNVASTAIAEYGWLVFLSGEAPWSLRESFPECLFQSVELPMPDVPARAEAWEYYLAGQMPGTTSCVSQLAGRFRLTPRQIRAAVELANNHHRMRPEIHSLSLSGLSAACRQQSRHKLGDLAVKIDPHYGWDDLVLPVDKVAHLREICDHVLHKYTVFGAWGFDKKLGHGKGLSALFVGPSGTGKTMATEVLARELELDLYKVDLSGVVSKYIGETEKNLARIFAEAEASNAILFFDEADALFGKRTEVSDAHDRYANIETSYLLQKMEEYEGVVILATNLRENMDEAFTRRIRFIVEFPFPNENSRKRIWQTLFPPEAPVSAEVDFGILARDVQVAGGTIKNIVLSAAFLAAADGGTITPRHLLHGTKREFEKAGKVWVNRST